MNGKGEEAWADRERNRERECVCMSVCMCVCACGCVCVCACVCACACNRNIQSSVLQIAGHAQCSHTFPECTPTKGVHQVFPGKLT